VDGKPIPGPSQKSIYALWEPVKPWGKKTALKTI